MNEFLDKASSHLTGKNVSEAASEELEQLTQEHPYFSVGQILLAKKYKSEDRADFLPQVQKSALFFNNPHWLHYQLSVAKQEMTISDKVVKEEPTAINVNSDQHGPVAEVEMNEKEKPEVVFTKDEILAASTLAKETLTTNPDEKNEAFDENEVNQELDEEPAPDIQEEEITPDELHPEKEEILEEIQEENEESENTRYHKHIEPQAIIEVGVNSESVANTLDDIQSSPETEDPITRERPEKDLIETVVEDSLVQPVTIDKSIGEVESENVITEETRPSDPVVSSDSTPHQTNQTTALPASADGPLVPIEPYYTVDYFASQGIKLVLDKNPQDKLGKQLRSFTDWLRHMKKLGPEDALKPIQETQVDPEVKNIADNSNTPEEIVTEAMADVLIKQGKTDHAIGIYNKLSFLNPDKSAYFADQIQKLKGS